MPGYRVFKVRVPREVRKAVREFVEEYWLRAKFCSLCSRCERKPRVSECLLGVLRGRAFYYVFEAARVHRENVLRWRVGGRLPRPSVMLLLEFYANGERLYGNKGAPLRIDLSTGVVRLRVPSGVVEWRVKAKKLRGLREEVLGARERGTRFVAVVPSHLHYISIVAFREPKLRFSEGVLVVALDLNSRYGVTVVIASVSADGVKVHLMARLKPPSHGGRRRLAARLQHLAKSLEISLPYERRREYFEEARRIRARERALNEAFANEVTALVRRWVRWGLKKGLLPIVVVDKPVPKGLRNTPLQGTLLRVCRKLENLARYEGALYWEAKVSGKRCPLCSARGVRDEENGRRYRCEECKAWFDRDFSATHRLVLKALLALANPEAVISYKRLLRKSGMLGA